MTDQCERCERYGGEAEQAKVVVASDDETLLAALRGRPTCSVDEAAKALRVGRSTAYAAARDGSLPTIRISNRILVPTAKLLAMLGLEEAA